MNFVHTKTLFHLPDGVIYLDGNSLGPLPKKAQARVDQMMSEEWGEWLIRAWNQAGWIGLPGKLGDRIGRLIGAPPGSVVVGDTLSIKVYQALAAALEMRPGRKVVLSDTGNFPTDLYMAESLLRTLHQGHQLRLVEPHEVENSMDAQVSVLLLTEVDYRTGRRHDLVQLTQQAHAVGALTIWDLAHSAGALPIDLTQAKADFAVGCTYKYLNGGPGAPAFIYVAPDLISQVRPVLPGWLGHELPFAFDLDYRPGPGIDRMRVGTPPILALVALDVALEIWDKVDMRAVRDQSIELSEMFIALVERGYPDLTLASPRESAQRGSQVSFRFSEGNAVMQALIDRGVIGDFRSPDMMRFGFTPLYLDADDVRRAVDVLEAILRDTLWDQPK